VDWSVWVLLCFEEVHFGLSSKRPIGVDAS
jgi:hypothetical protein